MARMKEYTKWHQWTEKVNNLHISSCQLPCLEVYVHLGKVAEESLVLSDQFACFRWHISPQPWL